MKNSISKKSPVFTQSSGGLNQLMYEAGLISRPVALSFWVASLLSYSVEDRAWTTSGKLESADYVINWCGHIGAFVADVSYFLFGFSVWWIVAAAAQAWLIGFVRRLRGAQQSPSRGGKFWFSLMALVVVSGSLEWSRLYLLEPQLPGYSGGVIGYLFGGLVLKLLNLPGSSLLFIAFIATVLSNVFNFSWMNFAQVLGAAIEKLTLAILSFNKNEVRDVYKPKVVDVVVAIERPIATDSEQKEKNSKQVVQAKTPVPRTESVSNFSDPKTIKSISEPKTEPKIMEPAPTPTTRAVPDSPAIVAATIATALIHPKFVSTPVPVAPVLSSISKPVTPVITTKPLFDSSGTQLPSIKLLDAAILYSESISIEELETTSRLIEKELKEFGVVVRVVGATPGPVITSYEIEPASGVKGSQIVTRAKDLARALSVVSIRVIETIPGKNCMALELPNAKRQSIKLSEILDSSVYHEATSPLTIGLGKDIAGHAIVADLAKMPHCLVAGTTGSGKSVGINAMILSLLFKAGPRDVRLLLIDPKMLEMSVYEGIPHLLAPVVTDMKQAAHGLNWCVAEMEKRYRLMSKMGVRNLAGYNAKIDEATERGEFIYNPFSLTPDSPEPLQRLPYIVVVIDELADLMMVVGKKIEELIARLAQKARAAGIHLVLATQRPSVDVITGLIKANIPTRLSFQVSSKIDSRTILDQMGAEALLGMGDMLYMLSGTGFPIRVHGAFVSDDEVHRVVAYLKKQGGAPNYIEGVLDGGVVESSNEVGSTNVSNVSEKDNLYDQAVEVVMKSRRASISLIQRQLKIGYNRAARIVEDMEKAGLVSAMSGSGQREVLVPANAD